VIKRRGLARLLNQAGDARKKFDGMNEAAFSGATR